MRLSTLLETLALSTSIAQGFKDTAPLLLFSSLPPPSQIDETLTVNSNLQTYAETFATTKQLLLNSSPDLLILISQPSSAQTISEFPELQKAYESSNVKTRMQVREVVEMGVEEVEDIVSFTRRTMGSEVPVTEAGVWAFLGKRKRVQEARPSFAEMGLGDWISESGKLQKLDLDALSESDAAYTILYIGIPVTSTLEDLSYELENEFHATEHIDLKRDLRARVPPGVEQTDDRPLFEKYQFFTPGIFMGIVTVLIMLSIGSVGLNAVSSLQVSYGAFDKENGPAAQRKQQQ